MPERLSEIFNSWKSSLDWSEQRNLLNIEDTLQRLHRLTISLAIPAGVVFSAVY